MKKWLVSVPFTGYYIVEVEAETEEQAIKEGLGVDVILDITPCEEEEWAEVQEWSAHTDVVRGNHFCGVLAHAEAEELEGEEDDEES